MRMTAVFVLVVALAACGCESTTALQTEPAVTEVVPEAPATAFSVGDLVTITSPDGSMSEDGIVLAVEEGGTYSVQFMIEREHQGSTFSLTITMIEVPESALSPTPKKGC